MKVNLLCVGDSRGAVGQAVGEYEARARRYWRLQVWEVEAGAGRGAKADPHEVRRAEEARLLARLPDRGEVVALTREGKSLGSRELARFLEERALRSVEAVTFVIGGAFGLGPEVLGRSGVLLSLSAMTLPHDIARLLLIEQLYRAGTIGRNEPYHKGP
jgi:23S rRNA (pseudouridine1915-N3)-methyltransferase